ncbi:MAG: ROK family protein [Verrucomicrobia bacterium]|nr:MAG: ROK family protein [Verrucomicrobiota bacterium]
MAEVSTKPEYLLGVDLGGTKILAGVFTRSLECVATAKLSTKPQRGVEAVIERVARCAKDAVDEAELTMAQLAGLGVGAPGAVDFESGKVIFAPNLPGWKDVPFRTSLEKQLGIPVFVENDCNVATLGVYVAELKSKPRSMAGIFVGTGIGGGIIINNEPYSGFSHTAGEVGHMTLSVNGPKCGCGNKGCFEALASRTAIFQQIKAGIKEGQKTLLTDILGDDLEDLRSGDLRKAIRRGDKFVERIVNDAAQFIGIGTATIVNLLNPEIVVLGGGVIEALQDEIMSEILDTVKDHAMPGSLKGVEIRASKLGDNAGITGGAVLARREVK